MVVLPTLLIADKVSDSAFRDNWRTPKTLDHAHVRLFLAGALVFLAGAMWPLLNRVRDRRERWLETTPDQRAWLVKAANVAFWLTVGGYLAFAVSGYRHGVRPGDLERALIHQDVSLGTLKEDFASILGLTTLTQAGIAFVILATFLLTQGPVPRLRRRLVIVFVLSAARAFFLTERLALIEVAVPTVFVWVMARTPAQRPSRRTMLRLAPVVVLPAVMFLFGTLEYSRSYVYFAAHSHKQESVASYTLNRIEGYYATAYNNGTVLMEGAAGPHHVPYFSIEALWTGPVVQQLDLYGRLTDQPDPQRFDDLMAQHANAEYNSPGGLAIPFLDYGRVGGLLYLFAAGSVLGLLYRNCCAGGPIGVFLYPALAPATFEIPRYLGWASGRITPAVVILVFVGWRLRAAQAAPASAPAAALRVVS
jgi:hypothetical protein